MFPVILSLLLSVCEMLQCFAHSEHTAAVADVAAFPGTGPQQRHLNANQQVRRALTSVTGNAVIIIHWSLGDTSVSQNELSVCYVTATASSPGSEQTKNRWDEGDRKKMAHFLNV